jgi:F-type H+-transporting ATPase subunit a
MAGHTLLFICAGFVMKLSKFKVWLALLFGCLLFLILALELGVAFLQAYVFTVLVCIYLNDSLKDLGH